MTLPPSGWYPSPDNPGTLRYWDGQVWTEHVYDDEHGRRMSPVGLPPPPSQATGRADSRRPAGSLSNTGVLMSATFRALSKTWKPLLQLGVTLLVVPYTVAIVVMVAAFDDVVITEDEITGLDPGSVAVFAAAIFVSAAFSAVFTLAAGHQLVGHFKRSEPTVGESLRATGHGLLRLLGWGLVLLALFFAFTVVVVLIGSAVPALLLLIVPGLIVLFAWLFVKLAFFNITAAVVSPGENSVMASAEVSSGRFWKVFGRILLILLVVMAASIISSIALTPLQGDQAGFAVDNGVFEEFRIEDMFPTSIGLTIVFGLLGGIASAVQTAIFVSGTSHIYCEAGGRVRPELESPDDGLG